MPAKERLRVDVSANAKANSRYLEHDDDLRPKNPRHGRRDPIARIIHGVPKEGDVVRSRANRDVILDVRGQADAREFEAEL